MRLLRRLEQTLGRYAIPNLTIVLIASQVVAWVMMMVQPNNGMMLRLAFIPSKVLEGEVWRLITFLAMPPGFGWGLLGIVFTLIFWNVFYFVGTTMENIWGVARYNLYLLIWYVATVSTAFVIPEVATTNIYLETSVFVAFAFLFPEFVFRIYFILPVKAKWLGLLTWFVVGFTLLMALSSRQYGLAVTILASFANFFVFFGSDLFGGVRMGRRRVAQQVRHLKYGTQRKPYNHECAVCGKTDVSDPDEDFRYCSQCSGGHAYCSEHLHNHEHIREV